jgi:anti-sigma regulatory factor (Ser/Thr protein kinase)
MNARARTVPPALPRKAVAVTCDLHVFTARRAARPFARSLAFGDIEREELVIVVSELASNIVKYGVRGQIALEVLSDPKRGAGVRVTAEDVGPAIVDLDTALKDGHGGEGRIDAAAMAGRKGLGGGLGAIVRFTDSFHYEAIEGGKRITVIRYRNRPPFHRRSRG